MRDWSNAPWVDPAYNWEPLPVSALPERVLMDLATKCNLRCPMCPVWGSEDNEAIDSVKGLMDLEASRRLLDETHRPSAFSRPMPHEPPVITARFPFSLMDMKTRGM